MILASDDCLLCTLDEGGGGTLDEVGYPWEEDWWP